MGARKLTQLFLSCKLLKKMFNTNNIVIIYCSFLLFLGGCIQKEHIPRDAALEKIIGSWAMVENIQNDRIGNTSVILIFTKQYCISVMDNYEDSIKINKYLVDNNSNIRLIKNRKNAGSMPPFRLKFINNKFLLIKKWGGFKTTYVFYVKLKENESEQILKKFKINSTKLNQIERILSKEANPLSNFFK